MTEIAVESGPRYRAFVSYSHKDAAFGRRLHRRLEAYRLPPRLIGRATPYGLVPARIAPIFRDLDELPAATDLSAEVREALHRSASLIVVCSPAAVASRWVSREVDLFRHLHPERPVLAAIVAGEPPDCFPAVLLSPRPDGTAAEPVAADFREKHDGAELALLKLIAGILGLGLDELVQRDAQRRARRVTAVTALSLAAVVVMGALTAFALNAQRDAERQRGEAEGLVEYMLTDLRDKLKGVGRLDVMTAVNQRALAYYSDQDLSHLPVDSLERRARMLHAMGEDDTTRGDYEAALDKFHEAERTTSALLAQTPNDPERIYDQAQSEYWIGFVDYQRDRFAAARPAMILYESLARHMVTLAPGRTKYRKELSYAEGNLCAISRQEGDQSGALKYCSSALSQMETAASQPDAGYRSAAAQWKLDSDLADAHADMGDAYKLHGDLVEATNERLDEQHILEHLLKADPRNKDLMDSWIVLQRALAKLEILKNNPGAAQPYFSKAIAASEKMVAFDPKNQQWALLRTAVQKDADELKRSQRQAHR